MRHVPIRLNIHNIGFLIGANDFYDQKDIKNRIIMW